MAKLQNYFEYANKMQTLLETARRVELDRTENPPRAARASGKKIVTFAPHPDDEIMTGLLPLRLMMENGWKVVDAAVSLGSKVERRKERKKELANACKYLGWKLEVLGFDKVRPATKKTDPEYWQKCVGDIAGLIAKQNPDAVMAPHPKDANLAHMATSQLVRDALKSLEGKYGGFLIETEVWSDMDKPNVLIEAGAMHLGHLMTALSRHVKEVERNDYHVRMPSSFAENVRRGAEVVGGQGGRAPNFNFGVIYAVKKFDGKKWVPAVGSKFVGLKNCAEEIFKK